LDFGRTNPKFRNVFSGSLFSCEERTMVFDVLLQLQNARQQPSTKQSNLIRASIRRFRQALIAEQTTSAAQPETNEVSRNLALSFLLTRGDDGPF
jgi:hypothetical protein